ncbi:putative transcription factor ZF-HD family [Medicago truncatula]|nr:putative transcription factor ZF-HD family [Medicago truncatula]
MGIHISMEDLEENVRVRHIEPINGDGAGESTSKSNKRFWTKFTHEQRKKMLDFAMTLGWKIKKNDENVEEFCNEIAVKRCVFKVWMYNNKHTHGKK